MSGTHLPGLVSGPLGLASAAGFAALAHARGGRPLHPQGVLLEGALTRFGHGPPSGVSWVDSAGEDFVQARLSRSAGLPPSLPDILGLALRCPADGRRVDVLMASTGLGTISRWVPTLQRQLTGATLSTIIPLRGTRGPVLLGAILSHDQELGADLQGLARATPACPLTVTMLHARPRGRWHTFGHAALHNPATGAHPVDTGFRFDAVRNTPPGSTVDGWARTLREPSYAVARRRDGAATHAR